MIVDYRNREQIITCTNSTTSKATDYTYTNPIISKAITDDTCTNPIISKASTDDTCTLSPISKAWFSYAADLPAMTSVIVAG